MLGPPSQDTFVEAPARAGHIAMPSPHTKGPFASIWGGPVSHHSLGASTVGAAPQTLGQSMHSRSLGGAASGEFVVETEDTFAVSSSCCLVSAGVCRREAPHSFRCSVMCRPRSEQKAHRRTRVIPCMHAWRPGQASGGATEWLCQAGTHACAES